MHTISPPKDWDDLNKSLWESSFDASRVRYQPYIAFRGLSEKLWKSSRTGLQRLGDPGEQLSADELRWRERRLPAKDIFLA